MASIVIKNIPADLHRRLKEEAEQNRRSMNQQVLHILDQSVRRPHVAPPPPAKLKVRIDQKLLSRAISGGRE